MDSLKKNKSIWLEKKGLQKISRRSLISRKRALLEGCLLIIAILISGKVITKQQL